MITFTQLIHWLVTLSFMSIGIAAFRNGIIDGIFFTIVGYVIGSFLGSIPSKIEIRLYFRKVERLSTEEIIDALVNYKLDVASPNFCVAELYRRGESIIEFLPVIAAMMESESLMKRQAGLAALCSGFPAALCQRVKGYNPMLSVEQCREMVKPLLQDFRCPGSAGSEETSEDPPLDI